MKYFSLLLGMICNLIILLDQKQNNWIQRVNNELQDHNKRMMELTNAISMEGYLMKQSPGVMKIFQKRYYAIRSNGQFLVWYGKKPDTINVQPKGVITIIQIQAIKPDDVDERIFTLNYNTRWFILRAESKELRDRWLRVITIIMDHLKKALKNKVSAGNQNNLPQDWKFNNASEGVIKSIRMENEKLIMKQGQDSQLEKSTKYLANLIGSSPSIDIQKYSTHGFLNKKGFITSETHWYLLFSQFDMTDEQDDTFNDTVTPFLEGIKMDGTKINHNAEQEQSSDEEQQAKNREVNQSKMQINCFYEYDIKKNIATSKIRFIDIISYSKDTSQNPYIFKITYGLYKPNDIEADQEVKQVVLLSHYMIEIQKWHKAFDIIFRRYSIVKMREAIVEKRFHKFQVKMLKLETDTQWRVLGSNNKPDYVYINQEMFKVGGLNFLLAQIDGSVITSKMSIVVKQNPNDEGKNKDANIMAIPFSEGKKVELVFENKDNLKIFKKKIKKGIKDIEQKKQKKSSLPVKIQNEVNKDTYLIDKRIRESSAAIQMNFYQMMQRPVSTMKQQKQPEKKSFFDKFLQMFCGPPKQQDLYS